MNPIISFSITVFNQSNLVRKCIESIIAYKGNDIEIIVSDDMSSEKIEEIIEIYKDDRIKYFRNETNIGHDRNILKSIERAKGDYVFILRTRDRMIPTAIPYLIHIAQESTASYMTACALNQEGETKLEYKKLVYYRGKDAIDAHYKLFFHPSGNIYRTSKVPLDKIWNFIEKEEIPKLGIVVHNMIRLYLAVSGDFRMIPEPTWVYTDTGKEMDRAVNHALHGANIFGPELSKRRFIYEVNWAKKILTRKDYYYTLLHLISFYLNQITWTFKLRNSDKHLQYHYQFDYTDFSFSKEEKEFYNICISIYDKEIEIEKEKYIQNVKKIFRNNRIRDALLFMIRKMLWGTFLYNYFSKVYKKYFKGI